MRPFRWALPLLGGALLAACGSTTNSTSTSSSASASPSSGAESPSPLGSVAGGSFCDQAKAYAAAAVTEGQQLAAQAVALAQTNPQAFAQKIADLVNREVALAAKLVDSAPDAVKADVAYASSALARVSQAVTGAQGDPTKLEQQFGTLGQDPKFTAATQHVLAYLTANCGYSPPAAPSGIPNFGQP